MKFPREYLEPLPYRVAERVKALLAEYDRLRRLVGELVRECRLHDRDYQHRTKPGLLGEAEAALEKRP